MPSGFRILHIIPTLDGGGAERQLALLVREQVARGYEVHLALIRAGSYEAVGYLSGAQLHVLGGFRWASASLTVNGYRLIRRLRPDVVQTWLSPADVYGGLAARIAGVPWIMSERSAPSGYVGRQVLERTRRLVARSAAAIIANSQAGASYWREKCGDQADVVIAGNALDLVAIASAAASGSTRLVDEPSLVLCVGRLVECKSQEVAVEAWARAHIGSAELRIHGEGPLRAKLCEIVDRLDVGDSVQILPFNLDWWTLLGRARALLHLSWYEGTPNVVLEAMAAGLPVIVTDIPSHREVLDESCALFVPVGDVSATADAIRSALSNPHASAARAAEAMRRVQGMTIASAADQFEAVYNRVLGGRSGLRSGRC